MKAFNAVSLVVIFIATICSDVSEASLGESDVIRIFNPNGGIAPDRLKQILELANLEEFGFKRSEETRYETDENGEQVVKNVIYYIVQDECSSKEYWSAILRRRLPERIYDPKAAERMSEDIEKRIDGRTTEYCRFGLEIHLHLCGEKEKEEEEKKFMWRQRVRRALDYCDGPCACCKMCSISEIKLKTIGLRR